MYSLGVLPTIVLFGAPSASHIPHTFLLAIVLALLSTFAPAYAMGHPSFSSDTSSFITRLNWTRLFAELSWVNSTFSRSIIHSLVVNEARKLAGGDAHVAFFHSIHKRPDTKSTKQCIGRALQLTVGPHQIPQGAAWGTEVLQFEGGSIHKVLS
ncbi:uncharacterized protein EDB93DRAFT_1115730 [Suillus bovinus]|uniref:uncharacterized protein n=1 Tax=Suillus bovinus TaxID=48563 RepID=UPI001B869839|nr:uncharacterized protein EDB93DRAFT_1115730 [Suillus bovinus]KAG2159439.1 hypothetical protein EDB93DRAFT_1115730 [Suillus bovinus]